MTLLGRGLLDPGAKLGMQPVLCEQTFVAMCAVLQVRKILIPSSLKKVFVPDEKEISLWIPTNRYIRRGLGTTLNDFRPELRAAV